MQIKDGSPFRADTQKIRQLNDELQSFYTMFIGIKQDIESAFKKCIKNCDSLTVQFLSSEFEIIKEELLKVDDLLLDGANYVNNRYVEYMETEQGLSDMVYF